MSSFDETRDFFSGVTTAEPLTRPVTRPAVDAPTMLNRVREAALRPCYCRDCDNERWKLWNQLNDNG